MFLKTARKKVWLFVIIFVVGIILDLFLVSYALEPKSEVKNLSFTNITDHQVTISWITDKPTKGVVRIGKGYYKDDLEKSLKKEGRYLTHHITITNLNPNRKYQFKVFQGLKTAFYGEFTTSSTLDSFTSPNPVYGRVISKDKKPIIGALIFLQAKEASQSSSIISTQTNLEGRWSLDLANLRSKDFRKSFDLTRSSLETVIVQTGKSLPAGRQAKVKAETTLGKDKPWSDIVI